MPDLVSEVQEDGTQQITETSQQSNYQMEVKPADPPDSVDGNQLSALFKKNHVLEVTTPYGGVIPFTYKKMDSATLMLTHRVPLAIDPEKLQTAQEMLSGLQQEDGTEKMNKMVEDEEFLEMLEKLEKLKKLTLQSGVIDPVITDEIYEQLDDEVVEALYLAISGGVTSTTELVEAFRRRDQASNNGELQPGASGDVR